MVFEADDDILPILKTITPANSRLPLLRAILLNFGADTHMAKYNVIWIVGLVLQPEPRRKPGRLARSLPTTVPSTSITLAI